MPDSGLQGSLPFPANQLCTDDFTGRLANNTNLAAKGIVALEAFAHLCEATGGADCGKYSAAAVGFVTTWTKEGLEQDPKPHYKIAYNFPNSCKPPTILFPTIISCCRKSSLFLFFFFSPAIFLAAPHLALLCSLTVRADVMASSPAPAPAARARAQPLCRLADSIKYNIVWQKLLNYSAPFPWKEVVAETEVPYYISHANAYGPPMDSRHTCQCLFARRSLTFLRRELTLFLTAIHPRTGFSRV